MPNLNNVSFQTQANPYAVELQGIERRRQLAIALQQQGQEASGNTEVVNGWAVPKSRWEGLSKGLKTVLGAYQQEQADTKEKDVTDRYQNDYQTTLARALEAGSGSPARGAITLPDDVAGPVSAGREAVAPDQSRMAAILAEHPATQAAGQQMMMQEMQRKAFVNALRGNQGATTPAQPTENQPQSTPAPNFVSSAFPITSGMDSVSPRPDLPTSAAPQAAPQNASMQSMGGPAGGIPMEVYLQQDPTGASYLKALQGDRPKIGEIAPKDYTPDSLAMFRATGNPSVLVAVRKKEAVNAGGTTQFIDPYNAPTAPIVHTVSPDSVLSNDTRIKQGALNRGVTIRGQDLTDARARDANGILAGGKLAPESETMARAIADGKLPPLSGYALNRPGGRAVMGRVMQINPQYNAQDYQVALKAVKDFGTGKQGQETQSANTGINHLVTLEALAKAQKNGNIQLFNKIANELAAQTGQAAPTNLEAAITMVAPEITKAVVGAGGGVEDRAKSAAALNPNYSPDQFLGASGTMKELFSGRLTEAERTYERTTKRKDFRTSLLSPAAREILEARASHAPASSGTHPDYPGFSIVK